MTRIILFISLVIVPAILCGQVKNPKRGIAYGYHSVKDMEAIAGTLSWWYNWANTPEYAVADVFEDYDMDFVPMTWNSNYSVTKLKDFYTNHPNARYLLGFNEPNFRDQANMTPSQAAAAWPGLEAIADEFGLELVSPAVNWCGNCVSEGGVTFTNPYDYLDAFFAACPGCRVDYIAVHNYMCYAGPVVDYLEGFRKYGKKIWLTEFACGDQATITLDMQKSLMIGILDHLDNDTLIYRYSWFTGRTGSGSHLIDLFESESGKLSELGELYVSYNPVHDTALWFRVPARIEAESYTTMSGISLQATSDFDGIANVGWIDPGDWLEYNLDASDSGEYFLYLRIAATSSSSINVMVEDTLSATVNFSSTGGWQNWKTFKSRVTLQKGKSKFRLQTPSGNFNINWFALSNRDNNPPSCSAGENFEITYPGETTGLLAGEALDEDGDSLICRWTQTSGDDCVIEEPDEPVTNVSGLKPGYYYFRLTVSDGLEISTDNVRIRVIDGTIGVEEAIRNDLKVYPNPASDFIKVVLPEVTGSCRLYILNTLGQLIYEQSLEVSGQELTFDISRFENGSYIMKLETGIGCYYSQISKHGRQLNNN